MTFGIIIMVLHQKTSNYGPSLKIGPLFLHQAILFLKTYWKKVHENIFGKGGPAGSHLFSFSQNHNVFCPSKIAVIFLAMVNLLS